MVWFVTKPRIHATRGMVINVLPAASSDHGFRRVSSLDPAMAARAATTFYRTFPAALCSK
jgi:hypothetical protein